MFRKEALEASSPTIYGRILIHNSAFSRWFAVGAAVILFTVIAFFALFGFSRKETVRGTLLPESGLVRVYSVQPGVVVERRVREGQHVKQGDVLFVLTAERFADAERDTAAMLTLSLLHRVQKIREEEAQQSRQTSLQQQALGRKSSAVKEQLVQLSAEIEIQSQRIDLAERAAKRQADLQKQGFVSESALQESQVGLLEQRARMRGLERSLSALKADLLAIEAEALDLSIRTKREQSALDRSRSELEQGLAESEASHRFVVKAPQSGRVTALGREPGQAVTPSTAMATIVSESVPLEAELYVPSRAIGFVKADGLVLLRYQAFPFQKFGQFKAHVREVSRSALAAGELSELMAKDAVLSEPFYRVRAVLDDQTVRVAGSSTPLMPGMQLEASMVLERRTIFEWIFEPLTSITGRV